LYLNHLNLGCVLINLDNPGRETLEEGLNEINVAARLRNRPDPVVVTNRAIAYDYLGKYALAVEDYEIAVRLDGEVKPWWLRRAECKLELGDAGGAKEAWKRVEARFPESAEVNAVGAVIFQALGEPGRVAECYSKIVPTIKVNYSKQDFRESRLRWGPKMTEGWIAVASSQTSQPEQRPGPPIIDEPEKANEIEALKREIKILRSDVEAEEASISSFQ
jgi:tetratricopeptide (TPR) repeat protein